MLDALHNVPGYIWVIVAVVVLVVAAHLGSASKASKTRSKVSAANDEKSLGEPISICRGFVLEREEVKVPRYITGTSRPTAVTETRYKFVVLCHNKSGEHRIQMTVKVDDQNRYAEVGRQVEVRSYRGFGHPDESFDRLVVTG